LKPLAPQAGVTLLELMIALALMAMLMFFAVPSFSLWIQNTQIRGAGEAVLNGLQLARAEAVRRNTLVRFQLTSTLDAACALSAAATNGPANWVISLADPTASCNTTPSDINAPQIIQVRSSREGSTNAVVNAGQNPVVFNALGRVTPIPAANITIGVSNPGGGVCAPGGPMQCLNVVVTSAGMVRMCNPNLAATDPQGC
jgi:type IV fimbrial biogenesis protein FimT